MAGCILPRHTGPSFHSQQQPQNMTSKEGYICCFWFLLALVSFCSVAICFTDTHLYRDLFHVPVGFDFFNTTQNLFQGLVVEPTNKSQPAFNNKHQVITLMFISIGYTTFVSFMYFTVGRRDRQRYGNLGPVGKSIFQVLAVAVTFFMGPKLHSLYSVITFFSLGVHITAMVQMSRLIDDYGMVDCFIGMSLSLAMHNKGEAWAVFVPSLLLIVLRNFATIEAAAPTTENLPTATDRNQ